MTGNEVATADVVAVLLTDGWHRTVPGSFTVSPLGFGCTVPGIAWFRFAEADASRPYQPATLAGPLHAIIAVRQVAPAVRRIDDQDRTRARIRQAG